MAYGGKMKINALQLLVKILSRNKNYPIKIISLKNNSTEIKILNKKYIFPKLLDPKKKYIAKINNNNLDIIEITKNKNMNELSKVKLTEIKEKIKNFIHTKFINNSQIEKTSAELIFVFFNNLLNDKTNKIANDKDHKNNLFCNNKESYFFLFTLPFYTIYSKIFIRIDQNKKTTISILTDKNLKNKTKDIQEDFEKYITTLKNVISLNIMTNKDDFINMIFSLMSLDKIDLKI